MFMRRGQPCDLQGVVTDLAMTAYFLREPLPDTLANGSGPARSGRD
jgi:hypothetical protein